MFKKGLEFEGLRFRVLGFWGARVQGFRAPGFSGFRVLSFILLLLNKVSKRRMQSFSAL